jgi:hypothetical protein
MLLMTIPKMRRVQQQIDAFPAASRWAGADAGQALIRRRP